MNDDQDDELKKTRRIICYIGLGTYAAIFAVYYLSPMAIEWLNG